MSGTKQSLLRDIPTFNTEFQYSIWWNLLLITAGSFFIALGTRSLAVPHSFIPGGVFGFSSLIYYSFDILNPGQLYFLLNIPLFFFAWFKVSRRFFWYSAFATATTTVLYDLVNIPIPIHDQLYAGVASGVLVGLGAGIVLRSLGSSGGMDVVAVYLFQRFNIGIGKTHMIFNLLLFSLSMFRLSLDLIIVSLIMVFITSIVMDKTLAMFSQRKVVFIISDNTESICEGILTSMKQSSTFLKGVGAYSRKEKNILMTVVNNIQLKRLEEITFERDANALFIVENTFSVIGSSFSKRKLY